MRRSSHSSSLSQPRSSPPTNRYPCSLAVLARATAGDEQPVADWLGTECGGLNARQQHRVVALFTADEHEVFTRGDLAVLEEEDVASILSPLPTLSRRVVASAAASLRKSHAGRGHW